MPELRWLLEIRHLKKYFPVHRETFFKKKRFLKAVDDVSLTIREGETIGLVGESGCGKSTLGRTVLGLYAPTSGEVFFEGERINSMDKKRFRLTRKNMQIIFQDPYAALNPRKTIFQSVLAPLEAFALGNKTERRERVEQILNYVEIGGDMPYRYPHELSGGQRQRAVIARAFVLNPRLVVCDEPMSSLDVSIQSQILNLMKRFQREQKLAYLFISHDLSVVRYLCDRVLVMYLGKVVETGIREDIFDNPGHPYTRALLSAVLDIDEKKRNSRIILQGEVPSAVDPPQGCHFCTRCAYATKRCYTEEPDFISVSGTHHVACFHTGITGMKPLRKPKVELTAITA
ncbi:MAG: ATP-binding cassette domain-containing protein [Treponema sp.]|jgi:oligopeptide/dipeptide ABC transporter ATP-binding protein|nr:ATP-binding cassette domain-containing protein [Treponema sp.]